MRLLPPALLAAALASALLAVPTATATSVDAGPRPVSPRITSLAVPAVPPVAPAARARAGATAEGPAGASGPVLVAEISRDRTSPFDVAALTWDAGSTPGGMAVTVAVHRESRWTDWEPLEPMDGEGPDAGTAEAAGSAARVGTDPLLTERADGIRVLVRSATGDAPRGLRLELIDAGRSSADGTSPDAVPEVAAATGAGGAATRWAPDGRRDAALASAPADHPSLITRRQWGADERLRNDDPGTNPTVKALILHHTAGSNSYSKAGAYAQIRGVYAYHTRALHWSDIAYNIVIDRYGRIYEGRAGSITQAVRGAHSGGFNVNTMGISVLGNFDVARPPAAVVNAVTRVMTWKAEQYGINPGGSTRLTSAGGGTARWGAGKTVTKPVLMGHRDVGLTACPGRYLYAHLSAVRASVRTSMRPGLTGASLSARTVRHGGKPLVFSAGVPTTQDWTLTVTSPCAGVVRTLSGQTRSRIQAAWDLRDSFGEQVPPGAYRLAVTTRSPAGRGPTCTADVEILTTQDAPVPGCAAGRISAADVYATSVLVGRAAFPRATSAVLAAATTTGTTAAPLAAAKHAPLLLTPADRLPASVAADLRSRGVSRVWLVGSTGSIRPAVERQLRELGVTTVTRITGSTTYLSAARVAEAMAPTSGEAVLIPGSGWGFREAMAAGGAAAGTGRPVLFVTRTGVPAATADALRSLRIRTVLLVEGRDAVGPAVRKRLADLGVTTVTRVSANGRVAVAAGVAEAVADLLPRGAAAVVGVDDPDPLTVVAASGLARPVLVTRRSAVPEEARALLRRSTVSTVLVVGGRDAVSTGTIRALASAVR